MYMGIIFSGRLRLTYPILIGVCEGDFVSEIKLEEVGKPGKQLMFFGDGSILKSHFEIRNSLTFRQKVQVSC